ncbi:MULTISPECIES: TerC family protein [Halocynthiibacter]|uniref:TerC family protein n=1 Tax=Halocynthiibacter halioticoli TaxID=2986804 RepID=A0AAE3IXG0_9RHOB|nr:MULTISPECIES: TerC family protein [Halocynthiibacter]MCV6823893.1 TerC family protein [Halocynthiibacter halioticoli]MCW4056894.1 TerC family protein [Halocynthiibacter sp. SDUM655004]MDE0590088.1 TerC family protein [Halocynthiibacter sp. C4]
MLELLSSPEAWAAFLALVTLEIVLGIDNLIFISIVSNKLPEHQQKRARQIGIGLALVLRLALLSVIAWIVGLTEPVFDLGIQGPLDEHGVPMFETSFSWRDIILMTGGVFLVWKATTEIQHKVQPQPAHTVFEAKPKASFTSIILQIVALDAVFSIDSILTAIGMTTELPIMVAAVIVAVTVMFIAATPVTNFVNANPTVVMLALAFLLMIGMVLIADSLGHHLPKGYIYAAMAFAAFVEGLNMLRRRAQVKRAA